MCNIFSSRQSVFVKIVLAIALTVNTSDGMEIVELSMTAIGELTFPSNTEVYWIIRTTQQPQRELGRGRIRMEMGGRWRIRNISIQYVFNEQDLQFAVIVNNGGQEIENGRLNCSLGSILTNKNQTGLRLKAEPDKEYFKISAKILIVNSIEVTFPTNDEFYGICSKIPNPYFKIFKEDSPGKYKEVVELERTETVENFIKESGLIFDLPVKSLMGKADMIKFKCEIWNYVKLGFDVFTGAVEFTLADIIRGISDQGINVDFNGNLNSSQQKVKMSCIIKEPILHPLPKSIQLRFGLGVQGSKSNAFISLLSPNGQEDSQHTKAIRTIAEIVQGYSDTSEFPGIMFGVNDGQGKGELVSALNDNPTCKSIQDAIQGYNMKILSAACDLPWEMKCGIFDALDKFATIVSTRTKNSKEYFVFLLLVDHDTNYKGDVGKFLEKFLPYPMSIIIIGIGNGTQFQSLKKISGRNFKRKFIQFVSWDEISKSKLTDETIPDAVARQVLPAIPKQVVEWSGISVPV